MLCRSINECTVPTMGVRMWLASTSLNIADTVKDAIPCARNDGPSLKPLMISHTAYPKEQVQIVEKSKRKHDEQ